MLHEKGYTLQESTMARSRPLDESGRECTKLKILQLRVHVHSCCVARLQPEEDDGSTIFSMCDLYIVFRKCTQPVLHHIREHFGAVDLNPSVIYIYIREYRSSLILRGMHYYVACCVI